MTVSELIEALKKLDPNSIVIIQKDAEGNGYSPLHDVDGNIRSVLSWCLRIERNSNEIGDNCTDH